MRKSLSLLNVIVLCSLLVAGCKSAPVPTPTPALVPTRPPAPLPTFTPALDRASIFPLASEEKIREAISLFASDFASGEAEPILIALPDELVVTDAQTGIEYVDGVILLTFREEATAEDVQRVLEDYNLVPLGMISGFGLVQAWIPDARSPWAVADELAGDSALEGAGLDTIHSFDRASSVPSEGQNSRPNADELALTLAAADPGTGQAPSTTAQAVFTLPVAAERYGNLGIGLLTANTGGFPANTLRVMWPHYVMQTFAAHALVDEVGIKKPVTTRIAIIDDGIGDGSRPDPSPDLLKERCVQPNFVLTLKYKIAELPKWYSFVPIVREVSINRLMGASIDTAGMKSVKGHGHAVAHCAAADGSSAVLGTGKDARVRMIKIANGTGTFPGIWTELALDHASKDPDVRVINLSLGTAEDEPPFDGTTREANCKSASNDKASTRSFLTRAIREDKIVVMAAGNQGINIFGTSSPAGWVFSNAPQMVVAATDITNAYQLETQAGFSQFGGKVTVSAPGGYDHYSYDVNNTITGQAGTSFATPYVAGLAAEMWIVGQGLAKPPKALQIVHLIGATADDLVLSQPLPSTVTLNPADKKKQKLGPTGTCSEVDVEPAAANWQVVDQHKETTVNPGAAGNGWDPYFGYGRINTWKAILALLNGGIPGTPLAEWGSIKGPIEDKDTHWYGFEIKTKVQNATVWIKDGKQSYQLVDTKHGSPFLNRTPAPVVAWKGVKQGQVPVGVSVTGGKATNGWFVATFSVRRKDLLNLDGNSKTTPELELRTPGASGVPFYRLPLDLSKMRKGTVGGVSFSNWVFTVETKATTPLAAAPTATPTATPTTKPPMPTPTLSVTVTPTTAPGEPRGNYRANLIELMRAANARQKAAGVVQTDWGLDCKPDGGVNCPALDALEGVADEELRRYVRALQSAVRDGIPANRFWNPATNDVFQGSELFDSVFPDYDAWPSPPEEGNLEEIRQVLERLDTIVIPAKFPPSALGKFTPSGLDSEISKDPPAHWAVLEAAEPTKSGLPSSTVGRYLESFGRYWHITRDYLTFDTVALEGSVIDSAFLQVAHTEILAQDRPAGSPREPILQERDPFVVELYSGTWDPETETGTGYGLGGGFWLFSSEPPQDWENCPVKEGEVTVAHTGPNAPGRETFPVFGTSINTTGWTQFRLKLADESYPGDPGVPNLRQDTYVLSGHPPDHRLVIRVRFSPLPGMPTSF